MWAVGAVVLALLLMPVAQDDAGAQEVWVGAALIRDVQRFDDGVFAETVPLRLNGASTGWTVLGGVRVLTRIAATLEWSEPGTITDVRSTSLTVNGRPVTITSTFAHTTRAVSGLAGYTHRVGSRLRLSYLGGVSSTRVERQFTSGASGAVLVRPSNVVDAGTSVITDDFFGVVGGLDAHVALTRHLQVVAGFRAQPLELAPEHAGWSIRSFVGGGWAF
jgi:hypothetical protein